MAGLNVTDVDGWRWISLSVDLQVSAGSLCVHLSNDAAWPADMEVLPTWNLLWKSLCIWLNHGEFYYLYFSVATFAYFICLKMMKHEHFAYQQYGVAILAYLVEDVEAWYFNYLYFSVVVFLYMF